MLKIKISSFSVDENSNSLPELELKSFVIKSSADDKTLCESTVKTEYLILMSELEYKEKINSRNSRKSNPLLVNFEEYE